MYIYIYIYVVSISISIYIHIYIYTADIVYAFCILLVGCIWCLFGLFWVVKERADWIDAQ